MALSESDKHAEAEAAFAKIAAEAPSGYRNLARLQAAAELAQSKRADAVKAYDEIAADASVGSTLQDLAAVRAGMLLVDTAPFSEMQQRLDAARRSPAAPSVTARASCWRCRPGAIMISPPRAAIST